jgi:hypothetical protein
LVDPAEVGVLESGRVFQPVTEDPVEGDVRAPDQREIEGERGTGGGNGEEDAGEYEGVEEVVGGGAGAGTGEIAKEAEIGCEEEDGKKPPRAVVPGVSADGCGQEDERLEAKEDGRGRQAGDDRVSSQGMAAESVRRMMERKKAHSPGRPRRRHTNPANHRRDTSPRNACRLNE